MPRYGLPYQGSKNGIAKWVVDQLPSATNLYDLFGQRQTQLTIISEYNMPQDRFTAIAYKPKSILASNKGDIGKVTEKLFIPNHQLKLWEEMKRIKTFF